MNSDGILLPDGSLLRLSCCGKGRECDASRSEGRAEQRVHQEDKEVFEVKAEWGKYSEGNEYMGCVTYEV